ncbi:hypothetical protein GE118_03855 [Mycoplasma sp. NEAQ87857]|uniref:MSC_0622 family F1-like ATPase gamma subunit n=1 Tax=Mycoplasma sp. NEAQ87857 TaxID=2683967 RepID=UPI0013171F5E|nr:hypothetical protein [Mycoplasma sp. NEAQ87857]QGZ97917.1 hypothetical protein GE118_03855 [Mycoplasma sp. NEAQ87857]
MQIKKIKQKAQSLSKIIKIVESKKNITLINILKLSKQISFYFERASESKRLIEVLSKKYAIDLELLKHDNGSFFSLFSKNKAKFNKNLWIYITEIEQYETNSYSKHEKALLANVQVEDPIIAIGLRAMEFCTNNNMNLIYSQDENDVEGLTKILPSIIQNYLKLNGFHNVRFVINSSKLKQSYLEILPLNELNFNLKQNKMDLEERVDLKKLHIYPNVDSFVENELNSYLTYMTLTLLSESAVIYQKYKLVAENQKINDLEQKQKELRLATLRAKREYEVEQISLLSKKKDLLHLLRGNND